jgi:hypothetical protein
MKCDKCGYSDNGTGDWAHACGPVAIQQKPVTNTRIKVNDHYRSHDRTYSIVEVWVEEGNEWVRYKDINTHNEYTCYKEAFEARFSRTVNE